MMRQIAPYLIAALTCIAFASAGHDSASAENTELLKLISQNEDPYMTSNDLAFFLATHNYDAMPNGNEPG